MKVDNLIRVKWEELTDKQRAKLLKELTFNIPDGQVAECYRCYPGALVELPRGAWHLVNHLDFHDRRAKPSLPELIFRGRLDDTGKDPRFAGQTDAVAAMFEHEQGMIVRPPGTGKTEIALAFMARAKTRTLVLVHTKDVMDQWIDRISTGLNITPGVIRGGKGTVRQVTVAMVQTVRKWINDGEHGEDWWRQFGCVILDECHHGAAKSFEIVLNQLPAYYRFGFTASETRADGLHPYLKHLIGPVIHKQKFNSSVEVKVKPVYTDFRYPYRGRWDWHPLLDELTTNGERNEKIANVIRRELADGHSVLVLSRRVAQLEGIAERVENECEILVGTRKIADRRRILADFRSGRVRCLLSTQLADEALDVPRCDRVILTYPGKHEGRIIQQIGRALRQHPGKENARIIDIVDRHVGVLRRQWQLRKRTYHQLKIPIIKRRLMIR